MGYPKSLLNLCRAKVSLDLDLLTCINVMETFLGSGFDAHVVCLGANAWSRELARTFICSHSAFTNSQSNAFSPCPFSTRHDGLQGYLRYSLVPRKAAHGLHELNHDIMYRKKERTAALVVKAVLNGFRAIDTGASSADTTTALFH